MDTNSSLQQYLEQLNDIQKKAHDIAKSHLGTSYNILRSNGYIEWMKEQQKQQQQQQQQQTLQQNQTK
jgi:hypothetical protein